MPLGHPDSAPAAAALGRKVQVSEADRFAANVLPVIDTIRAAGVTSLRGIATTLNARGVQTARGGGRSRTSGRMLRRGAVS